MKALQTEIELRYFDEDFVEFLADYFCGMHLDHHNHRRSKENVSNKASILWLFSQTNLPHNHQIFQKIIYLIEDDYHKKEALLLNKPPSSS